jgi:hypothetical protein
MIAIKSNKELYFPDGKGFVTMEINLIQNDPKARTYTMRLEDVCTREVIDGETTKTVRIGNPRIRFKTMSYDEIDALYALLDVEDLELNLRQKIDESFRQGLLAVTQKECQDGISGEDGKGQYYSEAQDWYILREGDTSKGQVNGEPVEKVD